MVDLETHIATPTGGLAPRCQELTRAERQCKKPARSGYRVCASHGALTAKEEARGELRHPGRPPTHGLYSEQGRRTLRELREKVVALDGDLDNTDEELRTVKAVLSYLFDEANRMTQRSDALEAACDSVEQVLRDAPRIAQGVPGVGELTVPQARQMAADLAQGRRLLSDIMSFAKLLIDANVQGITAIKVRAETKAKMAEAQAIETFGKLCLRLRQLIAESAPSDDWYDAFEARLEREILSPQRLALPTE